MEVMRTLPYKYGPSLALRSLTSLSLGTSDVAKPLATASARCSSFAIASHNLQPLNQASYCVHLGASVRTGSIAANLGQGPILARSLPAADSSESS